MNFKKIVTIFIILFLTLSFARVDGAPPVIPTGLIDLSTNSNSSINIEQAIVIVMKNLNIVPNYFQSNVDLGQNPSNWSNAYVMYAFSKGWLPSQLPKLSSKASKNFVIRLFLSCMGYSIYQGDRTSEQQSSIDSALMNIATKTLMSAGSNVNSLNVDSCKTDISKLLYAVKTKTLGWYFRTLAWKFYSAGKLESAAIVFKICADAGPSAGTTPEDCADAFYGYGAIMSHNTLRNYYSAYVYLNQAVKLSPNSSAGKNATKLLNKLPAQQLGFDYMPEKAVSYEELIAMYADNLYFRVDSTPKDFVVKDKNGKLPSEWARKYVNYIYYKGLAPSIPDSFDSPAPRYWVASLAARIKFLANYEYDKYYNFDDLGNLSADDRMFINISLDRNLFPMPQSSKFNPSGDVLRKDLQWLVNSTKKPGEPHKATYLKQNYDKMVDAYYEDNGILHFTYQNGVIDERHAEINMIDFGAVYYYLDDAVHKRSFESPAYKDEGTKYIKTRFGLNQPILDGISKSSLYNIKPMLEFDANGKIAYSYIKDTEKRNDIINDLVHLVDLYGMDGVHLDFEHMPSEARESYSLFVEGLSSQLKPEGKLLTAVVGAYSSDKLESASPYDLSRLGKACDYLKLVLYDDFPISGFKNTGRDGPISRLDWNERILKYYVQKVPSKKILMGIGAYAEDFDITNKQDAKNISLTDINSIISGAAKGSVKKLFNSEYQAPYYEYKDLSGDTHRLWFEDEKSFSQRMEQVNKYSLGGIFYYWLGSNSQDLYNAISKTLH